MLLDFSVSRSAGQVLEKLGTSVDAADFQRLLGHCLQQGLLVRADLPAAGRPLSTRVDAVLNPEVWNDEVRLERIASVGWRIGDASPFRIECMRLSLAANQSEIP